MKKMATVCAIFFAAFAALVLGLTYEAPGKSSDMKISLATPLAHATTCFKSSEYTSGMNKICIYNCLGSDAAITISSVSLCPLTINR